ncbi:sugar ABC transporter permease [Mangrovactinospora gilvigrisea]|uniref:Sugar ABC transporter permease n=1 Tax=Mangrovactinospora gilvigrisea TaxID=1428644 RepID=A0A1J7B9R8_9ACTN|nr:carbohydrate ABC transporter permease [Mangrovactinospora gilvigrisea]OIV35341.1 sugar ABC transporter permease [Mangrovactinospora gilvigrisea]
MTTSRTDRTMTYFVLAVFSVFSLVPLLGVLSSAFGKSGQGAGGGVAWPSDGLHWSNFAKAWTQGHFSTYLGNSAVVAVTVVVVAAVLATMAAYAFGVMRFPGSTALFYLFVLGLTLPAESFVIPLYFDLRALNLTDSLWGMILPQTAQSLAFGVFWMRTYFRNSVGSVIEAARIDGVRSWGILWRVLVPMGRPAITTMLVVTFMWTWNEFLLALVMISDDAHRTVPLGLAFFQGAHSSDNALLSAACVLIALPVVIVYVILQRSFIAGMLSGAVKE